MWVVTGGWWEEPIVLLHVVSLQTQNGKSTQYKGGEFVWFINASFQIDIDAFTADVNMLVSVDLNGCFHISCLISAVACGHGWIVIWCLGLLEHQWHVDAVHSVLYCHLPDAAVV